MPKYRTLEPLSYVEDGKVVSVVKDRVIELTVEQAQSLAGRVLNVDNKTVSMFPDGGPVIDPHFARSVPNVRVAGEHVEPAAPVAPAAKVAKPEAPKVVERPTPQQPKQESK